jgi:hypothetical protein
LPPTRQQKREYAKALDIQRRKLAKLAEGKSVRQIKTLYDAAQAELARKLRRTAEREATFTAFQQRQLLAQVRQGQALISRRMAGDLGDLSKQAQVNSLRGLINNFNEMEDLFTGSSIVLPIEEASRFWGVIDERRSSLLLQHETSMNRYGGALVGDMEQQLALSMATGETVDQAIDRIEEVADVKWFQAERIVRTEQSFAYNATHIDGIKEIAQDVDDIYMRWTEFVTDAGVPLDTRVGADSVLMHGQVARPGEGWTVPDEDEPVMIGGKERKVSPSLLGKTVYAAPLRPNGRETVTAWRPSWGGLAWTYINGRKEILSR